MIDAFGQPIVLGRRYRCSFLRKRPTTYVIEGTASTLWAGVNGPKIKLTDLVTEVLVHGVLERRVDAGQPSYATYQTMSVFPCHLFPVPLPATST